MINQNHCARLQFIKLIIINETNHFLTVTQINDYSFSLPLNDFKTSTVHMFDGLNKLVVYILSH